MLIYCSVLKNLANVWVLFLFKILAGALPAAILAIVLDFLLKRLEYKAQPR